jgi:hypothetical protein
MSKASDLARLLNADGEIQAADIEDGVVTAAKLASTLDLSGKTITNMNPSGVYLGGTGAANYLDDYEEGTWTPTVGTNGQSASGAVYTVQSGRYTKIGRTVIMSFQIILSSKGTISSGNDARIIGFPFKSSGTELCTASVRLGGSAINIVDVAPRGIYSEAAGYTLTLDLKTAASTDYAQQYYVNLFSNTTYILGVVIIET